MKDSGNKTRVCDHIRSLIAWQPTAALSAEDRRRVFGHVADCAGCAEFLRFVSDLKEDLMLGATSHPEAASLTQFAEDPEALAPQDRIAILDHLKTCQDCADEVSILQALDESDMDRIRQSSRIEAKPGLREVLVQVWNSLASTILRPYPSAVYLVVAVVTIVYLVGISDRPSRDVPGAASQVTGVVLISDAGVTARGAPEPGTDLPRLESSRAQFLVLEFSDLTSPPPADATYHVTITAAVSERRAWEGQVQGREFSRNYTLGLVLEAGVLHAGRHLLEVSDPAGEVIFSSYLEVR